MSELQYRLYVLTTLSYHRDMTTFNTVVLDYGGVYSFEYSLKQYEIGMINAFGRRPTPHERERIRSSFNLLSTGMIATADYIGEVVNILRPTRIPSVDQFAEAIVGATLMPSPKMVQLRNDLKSRGIRTGLLSDMCQFELDRTLESGRFDGFDFTSFSAVSGFIKRQPECFADLARFATIEPNRTLFVDDSEANIEIASAAGYGVLFADKAVYKTADSLASAISDILAPASDNVTR